jgi:hypothetical protein
MLVVPSVARICVLHAAIHGCLMACFILFHSPDGQKKAYVRLTADHDALDVANRIGII